MQGFKRLFRNEIVEYLQQSFISKAKREQRLMRSLIDFEESVTLLFFARKIPAQNLQPTANSTLIL